jgi:hypothetical protein
MVRRVSETTEPGFLSQVVNRSDKWRLFAPQMSPLERISRSSNRDIVGRVSLDVHAVEPVADCSICLRHMAELVGSDDGGG